MSYRIGLIGFGYWGPNLARNFSRHPRCQLSKICDLDPKRRERAGLDYPQATLVENPDEITQSDEIDVVVIATPVSTHHALAMEALKNKKHIWVEKPLAQTAQQALEMARYAQEQGVIAVVDHTFLFTGAVSKIKQIVSQGELGDLYYYDSVRVNLGLFQTDVNVIWDLAPHDLSIMDYILGPDVQTVTAAGQDHFGSGFEDVGYLTLHFSNSMIAHVNVNWLSPVKLRRTLIGGSKSMIVWDDLLPDESVKVYDRGVEVTNREGEYELLASYRKGPMSAPVLEMKEALGEEVEHFIDCLETGKQPINDLMSGVRVVNILELASESLKKGGLPLPVDGNLK